VTGIVAPRRAWSFPRETTTHSERWAYVAVYAAYIEEAVGKCFRLLPTHDPLKTGGRECSPRARRREHSRSTDSALDSDLFDFDSAIRLQTFDESRAVAVFAPDDRIGFPLADGDQTVSGDAFADQIRLDCFGPA
jgi:hypothetical protein